MNPQLPNPRIGVGAIVQNSTGLIVFGERIGSTGAGTWALPGGHLEHGESIFGCAEREVLEETGLRVKGSKLVAVTNDVFSEEGKHYVTLFVRCEMLDPEAVPEILEPDKCTCWEFVRWHDVKRWAQKQAAGSTSGDSVVASDARRLFLPLVNIFEQCPDIDKELEYSSTDGAGAQ